MKISTVLSCLGSVIIAELCNASVTVYLRPSTVSLGQLSGPEADVLLANHLGLESTASLDNGNLELLLENAGGQVTIGKALLDSQDDSLLVVVDADDAYLPGEQSYSLIKAPCINLFHQKLSQTRGLPQHSQALYVLLLLARSSRHTSILLYKKTLWSIATLIPRFLEHQNDFLTCSTSREIRQP